MAEILLQDPSVVIPVEASCLATDAPFALVRVSGPSVGGVIQVETIDVTDPSKMPVAGMILSKSSATNCVVLMSGIATLPGSPLVPGARYFAGASGTISPVPVPAMPRPFITQFVGVAIDQDRLLLQPSCDMVRIQT